jgi:hypothetical protein
MMKLDNAYGDFMAMLRSLGGSFQAATKDDAPKKEHDPKPTMPLRLAVKHYHTAKRGYLVRDTPKRDKSMSARQWKRQRSLERRLERDRERAV